MDEQRFDYNVKIWPYLPLQHEIMEGKMEVRLIYLNHLTEMILKMK
jgi:hypothetical protein